MHCQSQLHKTASTKCLIVTRNDFDSTDPEKDLQERVSTKDQVYTSRSLTAQSQLKEGFDVAVPFNRFQTLLADERS